eukprot:3262928-Alexandrium_andersonii.AAC.1
MCIRDRLGVVRARASVAAVPTTATEALARTTPSNDGFAIIAAGVIARVPMAVVGTSGLCMCSECLPHVPWG